MEEHAQAFLLRDGFFLLGTALGFVLLFRRLGIGATLGFLTTGAVLGPYVLNLVGDPESKMGIAELGITLLLFIVGLELAPARLWKMRHEIFGLGLLQVVLCGLAVSAVIYFFTGFSLQASLALGLPLGLSSTAQVLPMLQSAGRLHTPFGERSFAILLFQDLSIIPLITIIAAMNRNPALHSGPPGWVLGLETVAAIVGLILAGRFVIRPLFGLIGNLGEREMFVFAALFTVMASGALMQALGLSTALGAFIAGVMLADSPYRHELEADVEPFRAILLGLFFMSVGMMLDLSAIAERPLFVMAMALALIAVKGGIIFLLGLAFRMEWRSALALGLLLSQGGEFAFVLFAQASNAMLVDAQATSLFSAIVTLSMVTTPFLMMATRGIRERPEGKKEVREGPHEDGANAIVVGYGRFGQTVAQMLIAADIPVTMIDTDIEMIDIARDFGAQVWFGDGTRIDMLRQAGAAEAELIVFCIDGDQLTEPFLQAVHQAFPNAQVHARVFDRRALVRLKDAPIASMAREVMESAVVLARKALKGLDVALGDIDRAEQMYRKSDKERLTVQYEGGDVRAAREHIITQRPRDRR
ncbi:cation:proton antiporter [Novosphingobium resinovorum]|uniref:cation:proton antiporter domain-containing protein n=1 Tax=Sphingomonadaceae TaxID=41297 RepID=UPI00027C98E2|nr:MULTISPECIES: cation:proton antiporter [Sphingomonadaceae]EJU09843.1 sodium/hydrogen exchanger [Sphingomonas sp. LH128]MBF7012692.1 cation:proton antiporter [Novosphingobium sp. HR1a]WJM27426.1 cation:proton antiporter [Novosphingobium resinovorum]